MAASEPVAGTMTIAVSPSRKTWPNATGVSGSVTCSPSSRVPFAEPRSVRVAPSAVTVRTAWSRDIVRSVNPNTPPRPRRYSPIGSSATSPLPGPPTTCSCHPRDGGADGARSASASVRCTSAPSTRALSPTGRSSSRRTPPDVEPVDRSARGPAEGRRHRADGQVVVHVEDHVQRRLRPADRHSPAPARNHLLRQSALFCRTSKVRLRASMSPILADAGAPEARTCGRVEHPIGNAREPVKRTARRPPAVRAPLGVRR